MGKSVLGNDPFQRGAALRTVESPTTKEVAPSPAEAAPAAVAPPPRAPTKAKAKPASKPRASRPAARAPEREATVAPLPEPEPRELPPAGPPAGAPELLEVARGALQISREMLSQAFSSDAVAQARSAAHGVLRAALAGLGTAGATTVDLYGKDPSLVEGLAPLTDFLYEQYWRVTVENARAVPAGPVILVANHAGALPVDGPVLYEALRRERPDLAEPRWLVEDQVFYAPFLGTLINRVGAVRACPENALRLLRERRPVIVFPEGIQGLSKPFSERYQLKRFGRGGFVKIALRMSVPIVPVAIVGAEETLPLLAKLPAKSLGLPYLPVTPLGPVPLPAKWYIRFGEPLDLEGHTRASSEDIGVVQQLTERTRQAIEAMLQAQLKDRASVFGG